MDWLTLDSAELPKLANYQYGRLESVLINILPEPPPTKEIAALQHLLQIVTNNVIMDPHTGVIKSYQFVAKRPLIDTLIGILKLIYTDPATLTGEYPRLRTLAENCRTHLEGQYTVKREPLVINALEHLDDQLEQRLTLLAKEVLKTKGQVPVKT